MGLVRNVVTAETGNRLQLQSALLLSLVTLPAFAVLDYALASFKVVMLAYAVASGCISKRRQRLTPVARFALDVRIHPRILNGSLRVPLGKAQGFHGAVLAVAFATLDADVLGLQVFIIFENQPPILVPQWNTLVHSVVPGLQTLDSTLRCSSKHGGKVLLDTLPLELLVVPSINDEISLLSRVLLVDVPVFAVWGRARITLMSAHEGVLRIRRVRLLGRVCLG